MRWIRWMITAISLTLVVGVSMWESERLTAPGLLHPSHADVGKLQGNAGCAMCHGDARTTMAQACGACHESIRSQIDRGVGLHGSLDDIDPTRCGICHREHTEGRVTMISPASFHAAGVPDPSHYDHHHAGEFTLDGRHDQLDCQQCHRQMSATTLEPGQLRFGGLDQSCVSCHDDPHHGSLGADCASCHGQSDPFDRVAAFVHTDEFMLWGGHADLACKACHEEGASHSIAALREQPRPVRQCVACHQSPHQPLFIRAVAVMAQAREADTCTICHDAAFGSFDRPLAQMSVQQHAQTGFALEAPHDRVDCAECHHGMTASTGADALAVILAVARFQTKFPGRRAEDCRDCHADPHGGQFDKGPTLGRCQACHDPLHFEPARFDPAMHDRTDFALLGAHRDVSCQTCHTVTGDQPRRFISTPTACAACHEDAHREQFDRDGIKADCALCHTSEHFAPATFDLAMHGSSRFPLTGSHQAVACAQCHVQRGQARQFKGTPMRCAACHEDVHEGLFDGPDVPATLGGRVGCARCHNTVDFHEIDWTAQTHGPWTGYALRGAHASATCAQCHRPAGRGVESAAFVKADAACASCHRDVHMGQFRAGEVNDCSRCHRETESFRRPHFDHQRDARFALDETHSRLRCAACHRPVRVDAERIVVRYRPLGVRCEDCHDPRGPLNKERP